MSYVVSMCDQIRITVLYKELENFLQNRNLDVHIDQFSKIAFKCSNTKRCHFGLLYIIETIESIHAESEHLQILYTPGNSIGHRLCTHIKTATPLIFKIV
jgi:hypothetical protein